MVDNSKNDNHFFNFIGIIIIVLIISFALVGNNFTNSNNINELFQQLSDIIKNTGGLAAKEKTYTPEKSQSQVQDGPIGMAKPCCDLLF